MYLCIQATLVNALLANVSVILLPPLFAVMMNIIKSYLHCLNTTEDNTSDKLIQRHFVYDIKTHAFSICTFLTVLKVYYML